MRMTDAGTIAGWLIVAAIAAHATRCLIRDWRRAAYWRRRRRELLADIRRLRALR